MHRRLVILALLILAPSCAPVQNPPATASASTKPTPAPSLPASRPATPKLSLQIVACPKGVALGEPIWVAVAVVNDSDTEQSIYVGEPDEDLDFEATNLLFHRPTTQTSLGKYIRATRGLDRVHASFVKIRPHGRHIFVVPLNAMCDMTLWGTYEVRAHRSRKPLDTAGDLVSQPVRIAVGSPADLQRPGLGLVGGDGD